MGIRPVPGDVKNVNWAKGRNQSVEKDYCSQRNGIIGRAQKLKGVESKIGKGSRKHHRRREGELKNKRTMKKGGVRIRGLNSMWDSIIMT